MTVLLTIPWESSIIEELKGPMSAKKQAIEIQNQGV
jgi:hypothetical protein